MSLLLLVIAWVTTGLSLISTKLVVEMGLSDYSVAFVTACTVTAAASAGIAFGFLRTPVEKKDLIIGLVMGASGAAAMACLVLALTKLPGVTVFPTRASANIALTAALSYALWREPVTPRQWVGVALAVAAVYLLV